MDCGHRDLATREAKSGLPFPFQGFLKTESEGFFLIRGKPSSRLKEGGLIEPGGRFTLEPFLSGKKECPPAG